MKSIRLTFYQGGDAAEAGRSFISFCDDKGVMQTHSVNEPARLIATSQKMLHFFKKDIHKDRLVFAHLAISIDDIELVFKLPEELDHVCEVFETVPFPTALGLANKDPNEFYLNKHWLSRLPKKAKAPKFRQRFVKFVRSAPKELRDFRSFYAS